MGVFFVSFAYQAIRVNSKMLLDHWRSTHVRTYRMAKLTTNDLASTMRILLSPTITRCPPLYDTTLLSVVSYYSKVMMK